MNTILLFGMPGGAELFFIVLVIIMLFGSKKIPELARGLGKGMREIKNATGEIQREITEGAREVNSLKDKVNVEKQVKDLIKNDKEKKAEVKSEISDEKEQEGSRESEQVGGEEPAVSQDEKPEFVAQTVQRRSPYASKEPDVTSEDKE